MILAFVPALAYGTDESMPVKQGNEKVTEEVIPSSISEDDNKQPEKSDVDDEDTESKNIEDHSFRLEKTKYFYNGKPHMPAVICETLEEDVDYEVEYDYDDYGDFPTHAGTYSVWIEGIGDYYGSTELTYKIVTTKISLNKSSARIYRKGTFRLKASVKNPNGATTFVSTNRRVASVNSKGKVTAKSKGKATIIVKNGYAKKKVKITVKNPKLNRSKVKMYLGKSKTLRITGRIGKAKYRTSNRRVATVNSKGKITGKKKGKCIIIVKTNGITLKCKVTIKNPKLSKSKLTIHNSYSKKLRVIGGKGKIKWKSSNPKIATVTSSGKVKGRKAGKCTIFAERNNVTMKCRIRVPSTYEGYSIPDFGAIYGKMAKKRLSEDGTQSVLYKVKKTYRSKYISKIKKKGFYFYTSSDGADIYINDNFDVVAVMYEEGYLGVLYSNLFDMM